MLDMFFFLLKDRQDVMVAQYQKDGQVGPPPGACPLAAFPSEKSAFRSIPGCQVQPTVGEGPGNDPKISSEK